MKKFKFLTLLLTLLTLSVMGSCGKGGNTPVDQYAAAIDSATEQIKNLKESEDINAKDIPPQKALAVSEKYSDYPLTDSDKDKLKKSFDKYVKALFDKIAERVGGHDEVKEQIKSQAKLIIEATNSHIEEAQTLGELGKVD